MRGAGAGFLFGADVAGSGSEMPENLGVLEINCLDVFLAKIEIGRASCRERV